MEKKAAEVSYKIIVFAGTTEGRKLSELLAGAGISHAVSVATEYGEIVLKPHSLVTVHQGRMNKDEIRTFLEEQKFTHVIDATHPFAKEVTLNIKAATAEQNEAGRKICYLRLKREDTEQSRNNVVYFETNEYCARALEETEGNILLTTGSKELSKYCANEEVRSRLYVRVLPGVESLSHCIEQGLCGKQIIAMQGPFTKEMNEAVIRQYHISYLVTKQSGAFGGYPEKLAAAKSTGAQVFAIGCPKEEGFLFSQICGRLEELCGKNIREEEAMKLTLAGIGMGHGNGLTKEVEKAVCEADILLGAERMLLNLPSKAEKHPFYRAEQIIPYLQRVQERIRFAKDVTVVVLFSGDSGFYSGCKALYDALDKEIREGRLAASLRILPGISSVAYLAACIGESYHDAAIYSMHGKELCNLIHKIRRSPKTFLLTSGVLDINRLGRMLTEVDMTEYEIVTGYQLSYTEQRVERHTPAECCELREEGLYTCFVKNQHVTERRLTHGIADERFIRERVPMTKEEVREVSICKLHLREKAIVYDIGSGTGSVAVEIAGLSDDIQVYAVEQKEEAASLIEQNKQKYELQNIVVIKAEAPEALSGLPIATHAFIGGSGGRLREILAVLWQINPKMRIVMNAVSMETICEIKEVLPMYKTKEEQIVQLQVNRVTKAGSHHLMRAENPVWICAFEFCG
ncbi:MAG: precorrin-6A reductase [Lachnospiraceae bacterium]|nr:precorrin-6A reductase [Lachnospiraceae bacterium]